MTTNVWQRQWQEGKGALYREALQTTGFYMGRIIIVPGKLAPIPCPPLHLTPENRTVPGMRFLRNDGIYRSDVAPQTWGRVPPSIARPRGPVQGRDGRSAPCPSSAMSSGRLFLDRVARQHGPSPLHRRRQNNMHSSKARTKGDVSTLPARGHFYFALTAIVFYCGSKVIMSPLSKVEMSP
jgi:hypothetical protein